MERILVLGATGNIGWPLVQLLSKQDNVEISAGVYHRHPQALLDLPNVTPVPFNFLDPATFDAALNGVTKLFFVRPPQLADPQKDMLPFLTAAKKAQIKQVVFVSLIGVDKNPMVPHRKIEKMVVDLGLPHTFLRPSFFMQNLSTTHLEDIRDHHDLFIPAGKAKTSFIDAADIAACAQTALNDPKYLGQNLEITGPEALTYDQVAQIMSQTLGVTITYSKPGFHAFRKRFLKRGVKKEFVNVMTMLYLITRMGNAKTVNHTIDQVLHRPATSLKTFVEENRNLFLGTDSKN